MKKKHIQDKHKQNINNKKDWCWLGCWLWHMSHYSDSDVLLRYMRGREELNLQRTHWIVPNQEHMPTATHGFSPHSMHHDNNSLQKFGQETELSVFFLSFVF